MERNTESREGQSFQHDMAAGAKIWLGHLVVLDAGYAKPGFESSTAVTVGVAKDSQDNTNGVDGDEQITAKAGTWKFDSASAADQITRADVGKLCFVLNSTTVAKTDGGGTRCVAGKIRAVEGNGVWISI